jgi:hypothetical protein
MTRGIALSLRIAPIKKVDGLPGGNQQLGSSVKETIPSDNAVCTYQFQARRPEPSREMQFAVVANPRRSHLRE